MSLVIVVGAGGFIGRNLTASLAAAGREVIAVSRSGLPVAGAWTSTTLNGLAELGAFPHDTVMVHLGAHRYSAGNFAQAQAETMSANVALTNQVYGFCAARGIGEVRLASSVAVYPAGAGRLDDAEPLDLNAAPHAGEAPYAWSKRWAEIVAALFHQRWNVSTVSFRLSNPYGPHDSLDPAAAHVLPAFVMRALGPDEVFRLAGDPDVARDFIYVGDVVDVLSASLDWRERQETYNLCTGDITPLRSLAGAILFEAGSPKRLVFDESFAPAAVRSRPSTSERVRAAFGIKRFTALNEGLGPTIGWYRRALGG